MSGIESTGWPAASATPGPLGLWPRIRDQRPMLVAVSGLIALAWLSLWIWKSSPYGRFLDHRENEGVHQFGDHYFVIALLFVAGWTLMTIAMMLPTSLPLVATFFAIVRRRADRARLVTLVIIGYLVVWMLFAFVAHAGDLGVHRTVDRFPWLHAHTWLIPASTFAGAGLYQFSSLKYRCLDRCRSPVTFVMQHWHGRRERLQALVLGGRHGIFCLGCCWSLMLLMFAVGVGSLGWMLGLAAIMAAEKNAPWGRRLTAPLGVALLLAAVTLAAAGATGVHLLGGE